MSFDPDAYLAKQDAGGFDPDAYLAKANEKSVGGAISNLGTDIVAMAKGLGQGAVGMLTHPIDTEINAAKALPGALMNEGKRLGIGKLINGEPIEAAKQFGNALYDKPLTTFMDVAPVLGAAGKAAGILRGGEAAGIGTQAAEAAIPEAGAAGIGTQAAEAAIPEAGAASMADDVARMAPGSPPPPPGAAASAAPAAEQASVPLGATFQETVQNLGKQISGAVKEPLGEVKDFLTQKYGQAAAQPGFGETMGDLMTRKAQNMRFQELGATPGQMRKLMETLGEEKTRALSDLAREKGITDPVIGYHVGQRIEGLEQGSGRMLGGIREIAAKRGAVHDTGELVSQIKAKLDPKYSKGIASGESGNYAKALDELRKTPGTPDALAKTISAINKYASENKMTQAKGAFTDVANEASRINNKLIEPYLSLKELEAYKESLKDYGASQIFKRLYKFRAGREMAGRAGVGGMWRNIKQGVMDVGGNKVMENFYERMGPKLKANPKMATSLGTLSEEALSDILGALDDAIDEVTTK